MQESISKQYHDKIQELKNALEIAQRKHKNFEDLEHRCQKLEKDNSEFYTMVKDLTNKLKESEQEKNEIKTQASDLVKKARTEGMNKDSVVIYFHFKITH
jgi:hypothetical protein